MTALVAAGLLAAGCNSGEPSASSTSPANEPLPTIGLGSDLDVGSFGDVLAVGAEEIDTVVMIGDSITVASKGALQAEFAAAGFGEPVIVSVDGKRMAEARENNPSGAQVAESLTSAGEGPGDDRNNELWIVALGTNDIGQYQPDEIAGAVNEVLAHVPDDAPLVWVDTFFRDEPDGAMQINEIVADRVGRRGNAVVAPWSFFAAGDGVLRVDGVHPSPSGTAIFAAVVAETASRFLGR